ncbi:MAG: hypothetical protein JST11_22750 [Acidobacteria bacterium]|nr:hypothetical protein [Acidobacteriota bacterium]
MPRAALDRSPDDRTWYVAGELYFRRDSARDFFAIAERALIRLRIETSLGGRRPGALAAPFATYSIPLAGFRPGGAASHGWIVNARINGSRPCAWCWTPAPVA